MRSRAAALCGAGGRGGPRKPTRKRRQSGTGAARPRDRPGRPAAGAALAPVAPPTLPPPGAAPCEEEDEEEESTGNRSLPAAGYAATASGVPRARLSRGSAVSVRTAAGSQHPTAGHETSAAAVAAPPRGRKNLRASRAKTGGERNEVAGLSGHIAQVQPRELCGAALREANRARCLRKRCCFACYGSKLLRRRALASCRKAASAISLFLQNTKQGRHVLQR